MDKLCIDVEGMRLLLGLDDKICSPTTAADSHILDLT